MSLHCENDDILRTDCSIVVGGIHMLHRRLGSIAVDDPYAAGAQRIKIRAACDEGHLIAGVREPGSQVTANRSDTDDRYLQCLSSMERMWRRSQTVESYSMRPGTRIRPWPHCGESALYRRPHIENQNL